MDLKGRVVGVNSQIISARGSSSGIGFSVSVDTVRRIVPELIANGYFAHPWICAQLLEIDPFIETALRDAGMNPPAERGLLIVETVDNAPAERARLRGSMMTRAEGWRIPVGGDVITAMNGEPIDSFREFTVYPQTQTAVGDTVEVTVFSAGEERQVELMLEEQPRR